MARSTFCVWLAHRDGNSWAPLVDIKSFPDLGGEPENIETTTTGDFMRQFIGGLENTGALTFTANYGEGYFHYSVRVDNIYEALKELEGKTERYAIWMGKPANRLNPNPNWSDGKFEFDGELYVYVSGGGIGEAVNITVTILPTSVITFAIPE